MAEEKTPPLRPLRIRIPVAVRKAGKPQYVLEKDYALSYLLAGIAAVPTLRASLVFKGGTCLRKAYFPGYRFSEDLDFTSRTPWDCDLYSQHCSKLPARSLLDSRPLAHSLSSFRQSGIVVRIHGASAHPEFSFNSLGCATRIAA
jgi:hypothetical protein